jgi:hypothetical protein
LDLLETLGIFKIACVVREQLVVVNQKLAQLDENQYSHIADVLLQEHPPHLKAHTRSEEPSVRKYDAVKSDHHENGE